jgi:hypothetical protein
MVDLLSDRFAIKEGFFYPNGNQMILIHPPVAKPCEPPAGIAKLCGSLNHHVDIGSETTWQLRG